MAEVTLNSQKYQYKLARDFAVGTVLLSNTSNRAYLRIFSGMPQVVDLASGEVWPTSTVTYRALASGEVVELR